jgi:hypothetical protein
MPGKRGEVISLPTVGGVPARALRSFCRVSWPTQVKTLSDRCGKKVQAGRKEEKKSMNASCNNQQKQGKIIC